MKFENFAIPTNLNIELSLKNSVHDAFNTNKGKNKG